MDGSSPRLRGTDSAKAQAMLEFRFIPAPAGNSHPKERNRDLATVHPRACGEQPASEG